MAKNFDVVLATLAEFGRIRLQEIDEVAAGSKAWLHEAVSQAQAELVSQLPKGGRKAASSRAGARATRGAAAQQKQQQDEQEEEAQDAVAPPVKVSSGRVIDTVSFLASLRPPGRAS